MTRYQMVATYESTLSIYISPLQFAHFPLSDSSLIPLLSAQLCALVER